jgi:hypothetical protein
MTAMRFMQVPCSCGLVLVVAYCIDWKVKKQYRIKGLYR